MHPKDLRKIAPRSKNADKISMDRLIKSLRSSAPSEADFCKAMFYIDKDAPTEALEFLYEQSIYFGRSHCALEICHYLNKNISEKEADLIVENALNIGRIAQAIDAAMLGVSERTLNRLVSRLSDCLHIWNSNELEKLINRRKNSNDNSERLTDAEEKFYLLISSRVSEAALKNTHQEISSKKISKLYSIMQKLKKLF